MISMRVCLGIRVLASNWSGAKGNESKMNWFLHSPPIVSLRPYQSSLAFGPSSCRHGRYWDAPYFVLEKTPVHSPEVFHWMVVPLMQLGKKNKYVSSPDFKKVYFEYQSDMVGQIQDL